MINDLSTRWGLAQHSCAPLHYDAFILNVTADTEVTAGLRKALAHVSAPSFELAVHRFEASEETLPGALVLTLVGHATTRRTPDTARCLLGILLHRCYTSNRIDAQGVTILRRAYALFFACIDTPGVRSSFVPLLVHLTEHRHVTAHRIRVLLRTYQQDKDPWLYNMLDAFATYEPALLLPVDQVQRKPHHVKVQVPLALWAQALPYLLLPDMVPGLVGEPKRLRSHVPHRIQLALLVGVGGKEPSLEEEVGARLATSLGRLLAANAMYAQRHDPHIHWDTNTIPPFDAAAFGWLEQLYPYCASLQTVPLPLLPFIAHVIHSMGQDAVRCMTSALPVAQWEHTWRPTMRALVRLYAWMPPLVWTDFFPRFLQPLCYLAALDDVSDLFSSQVFYAIARMIPHWAAYHAPELQELVLCAWELQASLMLGGDPTLPVYMGILDVHRAMAQAQIPDVTGKTFPFPFFSLAAPPAMAGSVATLDRLCEHVCMLRASVTKEHHVLDARLVDDMATALVDMLWSGRAFAQCLQRGVVIDGMVACDRSAVAVWKQTCDAFRIVPFVLVASLSHGPWLAPLFEQYCHEALLPGYNIRAPITPSALRGARGAGLPMDWQYTDVRRHFLAWLGQQGAPYIERLLQALVPSLQTASVRILQ